MLQAWLRILGTLVVAFVASAYGSALAHGADTDFATWLVEFRTEARGKGIREEILEQAFAGVEPIERVIELDRRQPEGTITFDQYLDRVISDARVAQGRRMLKENRELLEQVAAKFGVQPRFVVALWGLETSYGNFTGGFSVIGALATLACPHQV